MSYPLEPMDEPEPSTSAPVPGAPLPRLWKSNEDSEETGESEIKKKKREKAEAAKAAKAEGSHPEPKPAKKVRRKDEPPAMTKRSKEGDGVLVEDTPELDTYETRQRIRIAVGVGFFSAFLLIGFVIYKTLSPSPDIGPEEGVSDAKIAAAGTSSNSREKAEQEARVIYKRAVEVAKKKPEMAVALLKQILKSYGSTQVAEESKQALDRSTQGFPLFPDGPTMAASPAEPKVPEDAKKAPINVVEATNPIVPKSPGAEAGLVLPANPPEPPTNPVMTSSVANPSVPLKTLPEHFYPRPGTAIHPSGWPIEIVGKRDGAPMMLVFGDTFIQGRDQADPVEGPSHRVVLSTYYIDMHEVTVRQLNIYQREIKQLTERARAIAKLPSLAKTQEDDDYPAVMVNAAEARDFASWARKSLPTEAQWEAAVRTPAGRLYPWGSEPVTWSSPREYKQIDPIRSFPQDMSAYGVFDLAGNAWEWTKDYFDSKYYRQFKSTVANNPTGGAGGRGAEFVVKGGSKEWIATKRDHFPITTRLPFLGFRCVLPVEGPGGGPVPAGGAATPAGGQGSSDVPF